MMMQAVLLRLAYLGVTNALAMLRLLPMGDHDKDIEILVLRHQLTVLQRQLHGERPRFAPADRALLAALLHRSSRDMLHRLRLLVHPDTVLRWHRDLMARRHAKMSRPKRPGRPPTVRSVRALVLRLALENESWGYRSIHGELLTLGIKVAASTVWQMLQDAGIDPAPQRTSTSWSTVLRSQAEAIVAMDFFAVVTLTGARRYVLAAIEHAARRVRILGAAAHLGAAWVAQAARTFVMDIEDAGVKIKYVICDRDGKYPQAFDVVFADVGITVVLSGVRVPRMNSPIERWIQSCRHELLDRTLAWNQAHLLRILREYEQFHNEHRPHRGPANARPLHPLPGPITDPAELAQLRIRPVRASSRWPGCRNRNLATVIDCRSRRPTGWAAADQLRTSLVESALCAAVDTRGDLTGVIFHSDHG